MEKRIATWAVIGFVVLTFVGLGYMVMVSAIATVRELFPLIIPFLLSLVAVYYKHNLNKNTEIKKMEENASLARESAKMNAEHALEHASMLRRQENYKELLSKLGDFIYNPTQSDGIVTAHLGSLAFCDPEIIYLTHKFIKEIGSDNAEENLLFLLKQIRSQAYDTKGKDDTLIWESYDTSILFPPISGLKRKVPPTTSSS